MSPSLWGQLDGLLQEQYKRCWTYAGLGGQQKYVPEIHVQYTPDGSLIGQPVLLNPPPIPICAVWLKARCGRCAAAIRCGYPPNISPITTNGKAGSFASIQRKCCEILLFCAAIPRARRNSNRLLKFSAAIFAAAILLGGLGLALGGPCPAGPLSRRARRGRIQTHTDRGDGICRRCGGRALS